ncbi:hypothetical protein VKT23_001351 [Stygiomarasmius scandens]|uniref:F-box domain-containing protein n=1 Tax=Marasmiellus scandens TaxID=2682957 RepID=A0ABR1KC86_9AGAR
MSLKNPSNNIMCTMCNGQFHSYSNIDFPFTMDQVRSNHALTEDQISKTKSVRDVALSELENYDREIERLRGLVDTLTKSRLSLARDLDVCHSVLSPIHQLPGEVLAQIFSECCAMPPGRFASDSVSLMPVVPGQYQRYGPHGVRASLSHVSSYWRNIALAHSALWSTFLIDIAKLDKMLLSLIVLHLERSRDSPLSFYIYDSQKYTSRTGDYRDLSISLLKVFFEKTPHWENVSLDLEWILTGSSDYERPNYVGSLFREMCENCPSFPLLQSLQLDGFFNHRTWHAYQSFAVVLSQQAPCLRALALADDNQLDTFPYHQLHDLDMPYGTNIVDVFNVLKLAQNLTTCSLGIYSMDPEASHPQGIVDLLDLKTFKLTLLSSSPFSEQRSILQVFFAHLSVPSLTALDIRRDVPRLTDSYIRWPNEEFYDMAVRSSSFRSMQKVVLHHLCLPDEDVLHIFCRFPHLAELDLAGHIHGETMIMLSHQLLFALTAPVNSVADEPNDQQLLSSPYTSYASITLAGVDIPLLRKLKKLTFHIKGGFGIDVAALLNLLKSRSLFNAELEQENVALLEEFNLHFDPGRKPLEAALNSNDQLIALELGETAMEKLVSLSQTGMKVKLNGKSVRELQF